MKNKSLKFRIILAILSTTILIFSVFTFVIIRQTQTNVLLQERERYEEIKRFVNNEIESQLTISRISVLALANNTNIRRMFAQRDREGLIDVLLPSYEAIKNEVSQIQFHLPDSTSFLRLHMIDRYGDSLKEFRYTVNESNAEKKIIYGLEEGRGGYGFRTVVPMFYENEHIGSVEYGSDFGETFLNKIKQNYNGDSFIYTFNDTTISVADRDNKQKFLVGTADSNNFEIDLTDTDKSQLVNGDMLVKYSNDETKAIISIPFANYTGDYAGYISVLQNREDILGYIANTTRLMVGLSILFILVISSVIYKYIDKIIKFLLSIIEKLKVTSNFVSSASSQLSSASQQLAEGSTEQAASIEETSAAMEETSSNAKKNVDNTMQAYELSEEASHSAHQGMGKMQEMDVSMQEIKKSSDDIAKIITVIDEIAFQTNILALNAAVEAARAGDAGAGFAVVAEEVRNLAGRSARAAKDTAEMIEKNINLSKNGVGLSGEVMKFLEEITENTNKVNILISEIAGASEEQSTHVEQVATAMEQIDQTTQKNAAVAQESSASSQELQSQAEELNEIVKKLHKFTNGKKDE